MFKSYKKCLECDTILFENESVCPVCNNTLLKNGVTEEEYLSFLIEIEELPINSTVSDILPYCINKILGTS